MEVVLKRLEKVHLEAADEARHKVRLDGSPQIGGGDKAMRPMELFLSSLAGCASMDVLNILEKGRNTIDSFEVSVSGTRTDAIPAVFEKIHLKFQAKGTFSEAALQKAVSLSVDKYCSVRNMLKENIQISYNSEKLP